MFKKYKFLTLLCLLFSLPLTGRTYDQLPEIGTAGAGALPISTEKEYGWAFSLMANRSLPKIYDPLLDQYIKKLGQNLIAHADPTQLNFDFFLVQDQEINAAAFLGGNVKINSGLFLYAKNESELASVIAHEIAHVTQRHLARMLEKQAATSPARMTALAGSILLSLIAPQAGMAALSTTMALNIQSQINYTRIHEAEADNIGIQTLYEAGYSPTGMSNFFSTLADKYKYTDKPPQMLLTHPIPETRIAQARLRETQFKPRKITSSLQYRLSKSRIFVRFNKITPTDAINFFKIRLKEKNYLFIEEAQYGLALAYFQNKEFLKSKEICDILYKKNPKELFYVDLLTDLSLALNKPEIAIKVLTKLNEERANDPIIVLNLVSALENDGQLEKAEKMLSSFIRANNTNILAISISIKLNQKLHNRLQTHLSKAQYLALKGMFIEAANETQSALAYVESGLMRARLTAQITEYKKNDLRLKKLQK